MLGEYGRCSNSSNPQRRSSCRIHSAFCGLALSSRIIPLSTSRDVYSEHHVVPVSPKSPYNTVRSLFWNRVTARKNKVANNGIP
ncbi:hypothetical protein TNCV_120761 [Trichonephila clavipes]|nr:hypothetical protein TNCV_120761 [Trichonephila clavipes]